MSRRDARHGTGWDRTAAAMATDRAAARLYGPLWPVLCEVWSLQPHTDASGLATLVALCAPADPDHINELAARIRKPLPGGRPSASRAMVDMMPTCADKSLPFEPDHDALDWVADNAAHRLWAITGLVWGLDLTQVVRSFDTLTGIDARPRPFTLRDVTALAGATPRQIPAHLQRHRSLDDVCAALADDVGVPQPAPFEVTLPTAMGAIAAAIAADPANGIAAAALAIRANQHPGLTPAGLTASTRERTAAHSVAKLLADLWQHTFHEAEPG